MKTLRLAKKAIRLVFISALFLVFTGNNSCERSTAPEKPNDKVIPPLEDGVPFDKLGFGKLVFFRYGPPDNNYGAIYVIDINARRSWAISYGPAVAMTAPMVAPDGSKIAISKPGTSGWWDIHVMNIDGSNMQDVSNLEGQDRQPTWTPDSSEVLFYNNNEETLYRQSPIPNPPYRQAIRTFSDEGFINSPFFVSKNLKLVFYFSFFYPGGRKICTMDLDGTSFKPITSEVPEAYDCRSPCWSPDGQKIAYLLLDYQRTFIKVMVMDADGKNLKSLAEFEMNPSGGWGSFFWDSDFSICWSPDGSKLVFNKVDGSYCYHLYLINADGTGLSQVTFAESVSDWSVSWSQ